MDRSASEVSGILQREKLAALLMATLDGVPMIYYGEEIGMLGERGTGPYYDEYRREPMEWGEKNDAPGTTTWFQDHEFIQDLDGISVQEQEEKPDSLLTFYRRVYTLRHQQPALESGKYMQMVISPANSQIWAFWRYADEQVIGIIFNFGDTAVTFQPDSEQMKSLTDGRSVELLQLGQYTNDAGVFDMAPASAVVLEYIP
jgi:glycosidase